MLYLLNSGYRSLYVRNVFNTLFIPSGGTNEYRYRYKGIGPIHVEPAEAEELKNTPSQIEAVVIFFDRFHKSGYFYHPLRLARLVQVREQDDRLYFRVSLHDHIHPKDPGKFNKDIKAHLRNRGLPRPQGRDRLNANDGRYAFLGDNLFLNVEDFDSADAAFHEIVEALDKTNAFKIITGRKDQYLKGQEIPKRESVFLKSNIVNHKGEIVQPKYKSNQAIFPIYRTSTYRLLLTYYYPPQRKNIYKNSKINIEFGENLRPQGSNVLNLNAYDNSVEIPFVAKRQLVDTDNGISIELVSGEVDVELMGSDASILFSVEESALFWIHVIGLVVAISALDFLRMSNYHFLINGFALAFQAIFLLSLWQIVGKKVL